MKGKADYEKFIKGIKLSPLRSIQAQCYVCNGQNEGGEDCNGKSCPLYPYMPYNKEKAKVKVKRVFTDEQKRAISERLQRARNKK